MARDGDSRVEPDEPAREQPAVATTDAHVVVPWEQLSTDALRGVITDFVTSEGTEYGADDVELETKIAQVRAQLERGEAHVVFFHETESVNVVTDRELRELRPSRAS
ncbi:MAG: YheU family protein [Sandaracinaceae bacterium]